MQNLCYTQTYTQFIKMTITCQMVSASQNILIKRSIISIILRYAQIEHWYLDSYIHEEQITFRPELRSTPILKHWRKNYVSKLSWPSNFRNWERKRLGFLSHLDGKSFFQVWYCMSNRPGELDDMWQHMRRPNKMGKELWAPMAQQSLGSGRGLCRLCLDRSPQILSSQSLPRNGHEAGPPYVCCIH